jgi:hypothetical protein
LKVLNEKRLQHALYFFLLSVSQGKERPCRQTFTEETLKKEWEGAVKTFLVADFATGFRWYKR